MTELLWQDIARQLFLEGRTTKEVATRLGKPYKSMVAWKNEEDLAHLGRSTLRKKIDVRLAFSLIDEGLTDGQIGRRLGFGSPKGQYIAAGIRAAYATQREVNL